MLWLIPASQMQNPSKQEQQAVIQFPDAYGCQPAEIHRRMLAVMEMCMSQRKW
jgi:hypothetical protein